jgi:hypothetical protein
MAKLVAREPAYAGEITTYREIGRSITDNSKCIAVSCPKCGKLRWANYRNNKPEYLYCLSCAQKRRFADKIKKRRITKQGYVLLHITPDNPYYPMARQDKPGWAAFVLEHRLIMAQHLGRLLKPEEIVHHKNGIKDDNRIENLFLTTQKKHSGTYADGYRAGYRDASEARDKMLEKEIKLLRWQIRELQKQLQYKLGVPNEEDYL